MKRFLQMVMLICLCVINCGRFIATGDLPEVWFNRLNNHISKCLRLLLLKASECQWGYKAPRQLWLDTYPTQIALTANQLLFTEQGYWQTMLTTRVISSCFSCFCF
jgi:hypothetical protein